MNIGPAIKSVRKLLSLTQTELAEKCFLSQSTLSCIESGEKTPTPYTINRICGVLNIPEGIIYLMGMQETDVAEQKKETYRIVQPMIELLALQIVQKGSHDLMKTKHQPGVINDSRGQL